MDIFNKLSKICETKKDVNLKYYSHMHCGGTARFMCFPKNVRQIKKIVKFLNKNQTKYFILGNGTNTLFKDDFDGVIINLRHLKRCKIRGKSAIVECGVSLPKLNNVLMQNSLKGFEWSFGIPGTIGGAICMNAGAYGGEIANHIKYAVCLNKSTNKIEKFKKDDMNFGYRTSIFQFDNFIILKAKFSFEKGKKSVIDEMQKEYLINRKQCQPIASYNLGSIFKKVNGKSAGQIIDELGLKGKSIGGAYISKLHANFIINDGTATSKDVIELIDFIKTTVKEKCDIDLQEEIKIV